MPGGDGGDDAAASADGVHKSVGSCADGMLKVSIQDMIETRFRDNRPQPLGIPNRNGIIIYVN